MLPSDERKPSKKGNGNAIPYPNRKDITANGNKSDFTYGQT